MKKVLVILIALLVMNGMVTTAAADNCKHRWVEATDEEPGFCIHCGSVDLVNTNLTFPNTPFYIQVWGTMNCREKPNICSEVVGRAYEGIYTIMEVNNCWGKLMNGAGWVSLVNSSRITILSEVFCGVPSSEPREVTSIRNARIGEIVSFGKFDQDNNACNGKEDIKWIVLDKQDNMVLLISKQCLDARPYHDSYSSTTWEDCSLRYWLNTAFLDNAFTADEQDYISYILNENYDNSAYGSKAGYDTIDRVFLLSYDEANLYFGSDTGRTVSSTQYAKNNGAYVCSHGNSWWWLRGPGEFTRYACLVGTEGNTNNGGNYVDRETGGVRPAIWIDVRS